MLCLTINFQILTLDFENFYKVDNKHKNQNIKMVFIVNSQKLEAKIK